MKIQNCSIYLLLCFFMLLNSTPSQAVTAATTKVVKEKKTKIQQNAKLERLKKKLSKKMAKVKTNQTEAEKIKKNSNLSLSFGLISLVFLLTVALGPIAFLAVPLGVLSMVFSYKTRKAIKNSETPEAYKKEKKKANIAKLLGLIGFVSIVFLISYFYTGFAINVNFI